LLDDRLVVAMLVGAVALAPGIVKPVPDVSNRAPAVGDGAAALGGRAAAVADRAPAASAQATPAGRTASDPRFPIAEAAASPQRASQVPFGLRVAEYAERFLGIRYLYGGSSPSYGFDCSGFVRYVYAHFGVSLAHSSYAQYGSGRSVDRGTLEPGDLVFFDDLGHVGIYIGNGRFIHAPHSGTHVRVEMLDGWYASRFDGARRIDGA
jgi:cell wall-associated NlpC family hydrolase